MTDCSSVLERASIGNKTLDVQHQKMLKLCQMAHDVACGAFDIRRERYFDILNDLSEIAGEHFYTEEEYMKRHAYVGLDRHAAEHVAFEEALSAFIIKPEKTDSELMDFSVYLLEWLTSHIEREDVEYKRAMASA